MHRGPVTGKVPSLKKSIFSRGKSAEKFEPCHIFVFQKSVVIYFHSQRYHWLKYLLKIYLEIKFKAPAHPHMDKV